MNRFKYLMDSETVTDTIPRSQRKYLFICGTPRSGTTALVRILGKHRSIALGIERYKHYRRMQNAKALLMPELFDRERFFDFSDGATNARPDAGASWQKWYAELEVRYERCIFYGDKIPELFEAYDLYYSNYPDCKFLFITRDPEEVAASWNARASNPSDMNWPEKRDYSQAVGMWNVAHYATRAFAVNHPDNLRVIQYRDLTHTDSNWLQKTMDFLNLKLTVEVIESFKEAQRRWQDNLSTKDRRLPPNQLEFVRDAADYTVQEQLLQRFLLG